ncbi:M4 family metallopeptidase [Streptomyces albipurpureus]|uniref:M4 family metallopeptidase n=1 Tax=Streptomyces albipurpureus TaxID=2897419 RepID=A0ABT0UXQ0_9ACTN|nr:M4 family metallopeptidase [Streptomyces sp. CWNU-1]MCM2393239.1 M4 family metallopeptidase [Streptomyces sp. CWNU-1]
MRRLSLKVSTAFLASAALFTVALPSPAAGAAPTATTPPAAPVRAGALPAKLSPAQQAALLADATVSRARTAAALGLGGKERLVPRSVLTDADGTVHTRYERTYGGLPVLGGDLIVHTTATGAMKSVTRATTARISVPSTTPARSAASAKALSLTRAKEEGSTSTKLARAPRAVVWAVSGRPVLAWESVVNGIQPDGTPSELHIVTDATTGAELHRREAVQSSGTGQSRPADAKAGAQLPRHDALRRDSGIGHSRHSGEVNLGVYKFGSNYNLTDTARGSHRTYDLGNSYQEVIGKLVSDTDNIWGDGTSANRQTDAVDAAYGAQVTWDYFVDEHNRYGIRNDGDGGSSRVHWSVNDRFNSFWRDTCFCVTYGDGGTNPDTGVEATAHEMVRGLSAATAKFSYYGEAGPLAEANSDIFAAAVEFSADNAHDVGDYLIREKTYTGRERDFTRPMDQPSRTGAYADYWHPRIASSGNKRYGAGPANHWFYLASEGSGTKTVNGVSYNSRTHDGLPVTRIGRNAAAKIWYRALTVYMTSTTDYAGARAATLSAAADLYGATSATYRNVMHAWGAVNVGTRPGGAPRPSGPVFENTSSVPIPGPLPDGSPGAKVSSPITVTGVNGNAPTILLVDLSILNDTTPLLELVAPDGTVYPLANGNWYEGGGYTATLAVDASAETANGTWNLRAQSDDSWGLSSIHSWKLSF